jgi:ubiquinone/menaquinone biosynthesis C-methylase UbiE
MQDYLDFQANIDDPNVVSVYDELPLWSAMFGLLLLEHVPLRRGITALDVGCGTGFPLLELAQRLGGTCKVFGLDPWAAALERARLKARVWNVQNVELRQGDAAAMPFGDATFDLIVSNLGINNFSDPDAVLRECRRVVRPAARLALTTNLQGHMREFYELFAATLRDLGRTEALEALERHIAHRATVAGVTALLERAGFQVTQVHESTAALRFADGSAALRHYFIKLGFLEAWKGVLGAGERAHVFARLEASLNRLAEARGDLSLTIPMAYIEAQRAP